MGRTKGEGLRWGKWGLVMGGGERGGVNGWRVKDWEKGMG
jgi:hypothetical protein